MASLLDALIYPGLGLGAIVSGARALSDGMIIAGAQRLASLSPALQDPDSALLPDFADSPDVNVEVAVAVAERAIEEWLVREEVRGWGVEEPSIGQDISLIHEAIRDGKIQDVVVSLFA